MAVVRFKCTNCNREIEIIERPGGLEHFGPCNITNKCRGRLYKTNRFQDYAVGRFPEDVRGLTNYVKRNVVYDHTQAIADTVWVVEHNLGVNPSVQVIVDRESVIDGAVVTSRIEIQPKIISIVDKDSLTLTFDTPESGLAQIIARSSRSDRVVQTVVAEPTYLPVSVNGIITIAANLDSGQFPQGSESGTCNVRIYYLEDEALDDTAFETAVFKEYDARSPVLTSAWNDSSEVFVNGQTYSVLTIDIGDPVSEIGAPSAGTIAFQAGRSTETFPYDQAANLAVLLSNEPHQNVDKVRNRVFRPDWTLGPAQTLDSFIFANGEVTVDQSITEKVFPPVYSITAPQEHPAEPSTVIPVSYTITVDTFEGFGYFADFSVGSIAPDPTTILGGDITVTWCAGSNLEIHIDGVSLTDLINAGYTQVEWETSIDNGNAVVTEPLSSFSSPGGYSGANGFQYTVGLLENWDASDDGLLKEVTIS